MGPAGLSDYYPSRRYKGSEFKVGREKGNVEIWGFVGFYRLLPTNEDSNGKETCSYYVGFIGAY